MARANMLLLVAGCVMLAAVCIEAANFEFQFVEQIAPGNEIRSFGPKDSNEDGEKANGYVYSNVATEKVNANSAVYGQVGGLTFYTSNTESEEVFSIKFADIGAKGGRFADAELHCRGVWTYSDDGKDHSEQELAIVGGSYGLANAYGTLKYTRSGDSNAWTVKGSFQIDDCVLA
ncbi:protein MpDIR47 [Marchantia polymorpha subsp. ruderalis]|uniref:Dirigent protein n=2 Tax=Marchantia polymorpha TaxID=3197 RepID=A0AAF6B486_MARPO|nr:hypothetical protein MARPO_0121s0009 [Marchantia polymorpha]BBN06820.1 hypothetical protein Mp_3g24150 [Marchantia polymorpha subsp. ruderalis]|eukprot:PTQ30655.1 hypothetical protein MARPO_0121s0009 [Marchantia polymorpha]